MTWQRDASATEYVWSYGIFDKGIEMKVQGELLKEGLPVAHWTATTGEGTGIPPRWDCYLENQGDWDLLRLCVTLAINDSGDFRTRVFPSGASPRSDVVAYARCSRTRFFRIGTADLKDGQNTVTIEIARDNVAGEIELIPYVALAENTSEREGFASQAGAVLATGIPASLWTSEPDTRPGQGIRRLWYEFPDHKDALYKLAIQDPAFDLSPTLFFNSGHPLVKTIIDFRGRKKPRASARDAAFSLIATEVWMQLLSFARDAAPQIEDAPDSATSKLASRIFATLKKRIKKNKDDLISALESDGGRSEVNVAIQHWLRTAVQQTDLVAAFEEEKTDE